MKIINSQDRLSFLNEDNNCLKKLKSWGFENSPNTDILLIKIGHGIIEILKNIENDIEYSDKKRIETEFFYHDIELCYLEEINSQMIINSLANKIKDHFNDTNNKFRNIPISEIVILSVPLTENANIRFFCKFR